MPGSLLTLLSSHTFTKDLPIFHDAIGVNLYDFTIAWTRVQTADGKPNTAGLQFYKDVIINAAASGMKSSCTLYHWDLPQRLQDKYHGWLSKENIIQDFRAYAELAFDALGDYCDTWVTMNEVCPSSILFRGQAILIVFPSTAPLFLCRGVRS